MLILCIKNLYTIKYIFSIRDLSFINFTVKSYDFYDNKNWSYDQKMKKSSYSILSNKRRNTNVKLKTIDL